MDSFLDIFKRWPNLAELSREMGVPYGTVLAWKRRQTLPDKYWVRLIAAAERRGISGLTADTLLDVAERARTEVPAPQSAPAAPAAPAEVSSLLT